MVRPSTDIALSQDRKRCNTQSGKITFPRVGKNEETQVWYLFGKPIVGFLAWESIDSHIISQGWVGESFPCVKGSDIKRTSRRTMLLKGSDIKRTSRRTALLKGRNTRTIQLPLRHLKGIDIESQGKLSPTQPWEIIWESIDSHAKNPTMGLPNKYHTWVSSFFPTLGKVIFPDWVLHRFRSWDNAISVLGLTMESEEDFQQRIHPWVSRTNSAWFLTRF